MKNLSEIDKYFAPQKLPGKVFFMLQKEERSRFYEKWCSSIFFLGKVFFIDFSFVLFRVFFLIYEKLSNSEFL